MLYGFLASLVAGGLATLYLLWRKSVVEGDLVKTQKDLLIKTNESEGWKISYSTLKKSSDAQIQTLQGQNDELFKALEKSGAPGVFAELLQKRNTSSVPAK